MSEPYNPQFYNPCLSNVRHLYPHPPPPINQGLPAYPAFQGHPDPPQLNATHPHGLNIFQVRPPHSHQLVPPPTLPPHMRLPSTARLPPVHLHAPSSHQQAMHQRTTLHHQTSTLSQPGPSQQVAMRFGFSTMSSNLSAPFPSTSSGVFSPPHAETRAAVGGGKTSSSRKSSNICYLDNDAHDESEMMVHILCNAQICKDCLEQSTECPTCQAQNEKSQWVQLGQIGAVRSEGNRRKQEKRKSKSEEKTKNKKVKEIESCLEDSAQSLWESLKQESELEDDLQVKMTLFESNCEAEKFETDKRQQLEMENLLNGHTLESQKLELKHKSDFKTIEDENKQVKNNVKKRISEIKSVMKSLNLKLVNMITSPEIMCPECPICFESFQPPKKLVQCVNGHLVCLECRQKPQVQDCPTCREGLTGRATAYEQLLSQMFGAGEKHSGTIDV